MDEGIDFGKLIERIKEVITNPKDIWTKVKDEPSTLKSIYLSYVIPLAAIPAICSFIGQTFVGVTVPIVGTVKQPFIPGITAAVVSYVMSLVMIYIGSAVIEKFAAKSEGTVSLDNACKLMAYSMTPVYVVGFLSLIPSLSALAILGGVYGLYLYYMGITPMTGISEDKRLGFFFKTLLAIILILIVVSIVVGFLTAGVR